MHNQIIHIRLRTLSPVHVGCGEVYEPTGFVIDESTKELISFDPAALLEQLEEQELQKFSAICRKGTTASLIEIYNFINRHKDLVDGDRVAVSADFVEHYQKTLQLKGGRIDNELNQFQVARTAFNMLDGKPYIPGSAIKGAIRTAVLNARNGGADAPRNRDSRELETRLVGGVFHEDPFRLIKVSDFMPLGEVGRRIVYAANRKKKPSEREAQAPYQIFEIIEPATEFIGTVTILDAKHAGLRKPVLLAEIDRALCQFYTEEMTRERGEAEFIGCAAFPPAPQDGLLLRLGRHSGAECVTVKGYRNIRIKQARNTPDKFLKHATTLWLAAKSSKPSTNRSLQPFGWTALHLIPNDEAEHCASRMRQEHDARHHAQQDKIRDYQQKAEQSRLQTLAEAQKQKHQEEELRRVQAEKQKYPWRRLLTPLADVADWGVLRQKALDNEVLKKYQAEPEVGEAIRVAAERVRASSSKTWTAERDGMVKEWLALAGLDWPVKDDAARNNLAGDATGPNRIVETGFKDFGDWLARSKPIGVDMENLSLAEAHSLLKLFKDWNLDNKKAWKKNPGKKDHWDKVQSRIQQLKPAK